MVSRTSSRQAAQRANEAISQNSAGSKRKVSSTKGPDTKRGKKEDDGLSKEENDEQKPIGKLNGDDSKHDGSKKPKQAPRESDTEMNDEKKNKVSDERETKQGPVDGQKESKSTSETNGSGTAIRQSAEREQIVPSNILEKGIIYFFFRPRVNVEDPDSLSDVSRSFFVLRPIPKGAQIEHGPIGDDNNCRLLMLPKKKFPTSGRERDMGFVEKAKQSLKSLKESFIAGETYQTQTRGERTVHEAKPYAEGVYAITKDKRSSHLAYILTIPSEIGEVQKDFGLRSRGSFILQSKNPKYPGPSNAQLPKGPEYPEHVLEKFRDLRWAPAEPEFLDYPNGQFLMVGEAQNDLGKAGTAGEDQKQPNQEEPQEELENLEEENEERIEGLKGIMTKMRLGDHTVFIDLGLDAKKYPQVPTTWHAA